MFDFSKIVNWSLQNGSHEFPGPDGGTCINEAAIVAAGFQYRSVNSASDCPPCFSRPIAQYAIRLNDSMPATLRQKLLMPFVTRLSGTADTPDVEIKRVRFMALETSNRIMSLLCDEVLKRPDFAERCRNAKDLREAAKVCRETAAYAGAYAANAGAYAANAANAAAYAAYAAAYAAYAAEAAAYAANAADALEKYFPIAVGILDEAIMIGNHPTIDDVELINKRLEGAKRCKIAA